MNIHRTAPGILAGLTLALALSAVPPAAAQQAPASEPSPRTASQPAAADTPPGPGEQVGDTTRYLLQLQVAGTQAGAPLPTLGEEATASYRRYLKSFEQPIPEFFGSPVGKNADYGH